MEEPDGDTIIIFLVMAGFNNLESLRESRGPSGLGWPISISVGHHSLDRGSVLGGEGKLSTGMRAFIHCLPLLTVNMTFCFQFLMP